MPKIVDRTQKRTEILAAAAAAFSRDGYRGTNLQRVAAAAGMGKSSLYHYFPTREALFTALVQSLLQREVSVFDEIAAADALATARLGRLLDALTHLFTAWTGVGPLLFDFLGEVQGRRALRRTVERVRGAVTMIIRAGQRARQFRSGDAGALATVIVACVDGLLLQELIEPGTTQTAAVQRALRAVVGAALAVDMDGAE